LVVFQGLIEIAHSFEYDGEVVVNIGGLLPVVVHFKYFERTGCLFQRFIELQQSVQHPALVHHQHADFQSVRIFFQVCKSLRILADRFFLDALLVLDTSDISQCVPFLNVAVGKFDDVLPRIDGGIQVTQQFLVLLQVP